MFNPLPPSAPLCRLCFNFSNAPKDTLLPFLLQYAEALRALRMYDPTLNTEDDWSQVLEALASEFQLEARELYDLCVSDRVDPTHQCQYKNKSELEFHGKERFRQNMHML